MKRGRCSTCARWSFLVVIFTVFAACTNPVLPTVTEEEAKEVYLLIGNLMNGFGLMIGDMNPAPTSEITLSKGVVYDPVKRQLRFSELYIEGMQGNSSGYKNLTGIVSTGTAKESSEGDFTLFGNGNVKKFKFVRTDWGRTVSVTANDQYSFKWNSM